MCRSARSARKLLTATPVAIRSPASAGGIEPYLISTAAVPAGYGLDR
jgi:hypothetical protein